MQLLRHNHTCKHSPTCIRAPGIRYADIRCCWDKTLWRTCHGPALAAPMANLLNDTAHFLRANPTEVLVLEFSHLAGGPSEQNKTLLM